MTQPDPIKTIPMAAVLNDFKNHKITMRTALQAINTEIYKARQEQVMQDFNSLVMGDVGEEVDELTLIKWRLSTIARIEKESEQLTPIQSQPEKESNV